MLNLYLEKYDILTGHNYDILLSDLKEYEIRFGDYINLQQKKLGSYTKKAQNIINDLLDNNDELVYINTFNYGFSSSEIIELMISSLNSFC